jgi:septum site-determining protein MinD
MLAIDDVLDILSLPLLGVVPESRDVLRASNTGSPVTLCNPASAPARAYQDAALRLNGESVTMTIPANRRNLMGVLFGRRAA